MKERKSIDMRGLNAAAAAVRELGRVWFKVARADYKGAGEPYGPTTAGFRRWYRSVYEVAPSKSVHYP